MTGGLSDLAPSNYTVSTNRLVAVMGITTTLSPAGFSREGVRRVWALLTLVAMMTLGGTAVANDVAVKDISFSSKPGSKFEIRLDFDGTPPQPKTYTIEKPARISMDLPGVSSDLDQKKFALPYGNATGVIVLESGGRTRMIVNLVKLVPFETRIEGNSLIVEVGNEGANEYLKPVSDPLALGTGAQDFETAVSRIEIACRTISTLSTFGNNTAVAPVFATAVRSSYPQDEPRVLTRIAT